MASSLRQRTPGLIGKLLERSDRFDLVQAVRILAAHSAYAGSGRELPGDGTRADRDLVQFKTSLGLAFPAEDLVALTAPEAAESAAILEIACLGLIGPAGVLPQHYTELALERRRSKDASLADFFDFLQARSIALQVAAAWRESPAVEAELALHYPRHADPFGLVWASSVGLHAKALRTSRPLPAGFRLYFAGHYARKVRTVASLEALLSDLLGVPARIREGLGRWLSIPREDRGRLLQGGSGRLGRDIFIGERLFEVRSLIEIEIGPLDLAQYLRLAPGTDGMTSLLHAVDSYLEPGLQATIQFQIRSDGSAGIRLGDQGGGPKTSLGRDAWLEYAPGPRTIRRAVFGPWIFQDVTTAR